MPIAYIVFFYFLKKEGKRQRTRQGQKDHRLTDRLRQRGRERERERERDTHTHTYTKHVDISVPN